MSCTLMRRVQLDFCKSQREVEQVNRTVLVWLKGLLAAFVNASMTSVAVLSFGADWHLAWKMAAFEGLKGVANYMKQSPIPGDETKAGEETHGK